MALVLSAALLVTSLLVDVVPLWSPAAALVVLGVSAVAVPHLMYRRWRYVIRQRDLYVSRGAVFFRQVLVPFDRIQYVETNHGPLDRAFKLAQVSVYTAAGKAVQIPGLKQREAEALREELSRVAGTEVV